MVTNIDWHPVFQLFSALLEEEHYGGPILNKNTPELAVLSLCRLSVGSGERFLQKDGIVY